MKAINHLRTEKTVLLIEPNKNDRESISYPLRANGYIVIEGDNTQYGLNVLDTERVDVIITALHMKPTPGTRLLEVAKRKDKGIGVIFITDYGNIETAVKSMRSGAFDFLQKPVNIDKLIAIVGKVIENQAVALENISLHQQLDRKYGLSNIIGNSNQMQHVFKKISQVADSHVTVLITGESGTGKELVAHAIHQNSPRKNMPFIRLNCGALAEGVVESELFGHEKGSFTGAVNRRRGRFELAHNGTLFLDEIGEITPTVQVKLLRVLETGDFERVGGMNTLSADVRLITATNRNLLEDVQSGRYREDLYYRLNVVHIELPPLRDRTEDLPLLVDAFIQEFSEEYQKNMRGISSNAMTCFYQYPWPGNVRELRNCIEGMIVLAQDSVLNVDDIPYQIRQGAQRRETIDQQTHLESRLKHASQTIMHGLNEYIQAYLEHAHPLSLPFPKQDQTVIDHLPIEIGSSLQDIEKEVIEATLKKTEYNKSQTAKILGIGRKTLYKKLEEYQINVNNTEQNQS